MPRPRPPFAPDAWRRDPLFRGHEGALAALSDLDEFPTAAELDARLGPLVRSALSHPVRFRAQAQREPLRYEASIVQAGEIPTRDGSAHDLLNALAWATFPRAKLALHTRFHEAEALRREPGRSRVQDRLALLDEGGVLTGGGAAFVFGHALLEHRIAGLALARAEEIALPNLEPASRTLADVQFADVLRAWREPVPPRPPGVPLLALFPEAGL